MWEPFLDRTTQSCTVVNTPGARGFYKKKNDLLSVEYLNYIHKDTLSYLDHYPMKNPKPDAKKVPNAQKPRKKDERKPPKPVPVYFRVPVEAITEPKRPRTVPKCKGSESCKCGAKCHKPSELEKLRRNITSLLAKPQPLVPSPKPLAPSPKPLAPIPEPLAPIPKPALVVPHVSEVKASLQKPLEVSERTFVTSQSLPLEDAQVKKKVEIVSVKGSVSRKSTDSAAGLGSLLKKYLYHRGVGLGLQYKLFKVMVVRNLDNFLM